MSAFRISINGTPWFDSDDLTTLTMAVEQLRRNPRPRVSLHASAGEGPMQWLDADLKPGDAILIEVLEEATEEDATASGCDFCGRAWHEVSLSVESRTTTICGDCIDDFGGALGTNGTLPIAASFRDEPDCVCGFCGRRPKEIAGVIARNGHAICAPCVHACVDSKSDARVPDRSHDQ